MKKSAFTIACAISAMAIGAMANAQDFEGAPSYGTLKFTGDPVQLQARAAGALSLTHLSDSCYGYVSAQPTFNVEVGAGENVFLAVGGEDDLTMAVRAPNGDIVCDDDSAGDLNPGIQLTNTQSGTYEVWVGTYEAGMGYPLIMAHVTADGFNTKNPFTVELDLNAAAEDSVRLRDRGDDTWSTTVRAGGEADLGALSNDEDEIWCSGYAGQAADLSVNYQRRDENAYWLLESEMDNTLAIITPSGEVMCNDDQVDLNAGILIENPERGEYKIFAGVLGNRNQTTDATLTVSPIGFAGIDRSLNPNAEPMHGRVLIPAASGDDPIATSVTAGGPISVEDTRTNETTDDYQTYCPGYVGPNPTQIVYYQGGDGFHVSMTADGDTTLSVAGPDGDWYCDDDSLGNADPAVFVDGEAGDYRIYAGTFGNDASPEASAAQLFLSTQGPGPEPQSLLMQTNATPESGPWILNSGETASYDVRAGGVANPSYNGYEGYCAGNFSDRANVGIDWQGSGLLSFTADSDVEFPTDMSADLTMAVYTPSGEWLCDDDGGEGFNPAIELPNAQTGNYLIFVGSFGNEVERGALHISQDAVVDDHGHEDHFH
jgi:hypothetical protein